MWWNTVAVDEGIEFFGSALGDGWSVQVATNEHRLTWKERVTKWHHVTNGSMFPCPGMKFALGFGVWTILRTTHVIKCCAQGNGCDACDDAEDAEDEREIGLLSGTCDDQLVWTDAEVWALD